ncbi:DUF2339 domain-containing protein [Lysinibacillus halotolerans]|uniref:DUF2339 domain-containing protein n=1 Tax=Lysinibacillus halotolerans TaxID=1368476 RepID=A0A3M8HG33_9BACI|nr:DUF2339 domain-containing protein [Lysinibacillus halotolerans]RND01402.1 hypothetical protein EC501_01980 [Lysinibacillus halotolerans]
MQNDTEKRIDYLEKEVRELRLELNQLKSATTGFEQPLPIKVKKTVEKVPMELQKAKVNPVNSTEKTRPKIQTVPPSKKQALPPKKQKSFEEIIVWSLPKIFMIILVLGVLWGLKLISDFGLLSTEVKLVLAYGLSIALFVIAYRMDKMKRDTSQVLTVVLYGGTFCIGILTTAAGAIIYEVLGLYFALLIAFVYIAYGVAICYVKKNEVLSIFVMFTSLLLPYLLEYMDFNGPWILLYVLIIFIAMQFILIKHVQKIALYITYGFSILAVIIIWLLNQEHHWFYLSSVIILNGLLLYVWWHQNKVRGEYIAFHEGLLFSLSGLTVAIVNFITNEPELALFFLTIIYIQFAYQAYRNKIKQLVDVIGTLSILTVFNMLLALDLSNTIDIVLFPFSAFLSIMLAIRIGATIMKITYSILMTITVFNHLLLSDVKPFWTIEHANYLFILVYLIVIFLYVQKQRAVKVNDNSKATISFSGDLLPIIITSFFFFYVNQFDYSYISNDYPYATFILIAVATFGSIFMPKRLTGRALKYVLIFAFTISTINLLPSHYVFGLEILLNIFARFIYICFIIWFMVDILMKGTLYETWIRKVKIDLDGLHTVCILAGMMLLYGLLNQLQFDQLLNPIFVIASKTILLFIVSSISLWISTTYHYKKVKVMGYALIVIAIFKLVFFDLSSLNLFIRAILFISIGGLGLFLSNKLLSKNGKVEEK